MHKSENHPASDNAKRPSVKDSGNFSGIRKVYYSHMQPEGYPLSCRSVGTIGKNHILSRFYLLKACSLLMLKIDTFLKIIPLPNHPCTTILINLSILRII